jgi:hypothetical protein
MDKVIGLKNIDLSLDMTKVIQTLVNITSGMQDKQNLIAFTTALTERELKAYKIEAELQEKIWANVGRYYEQRVCDYRRSLRKKKLFWFIRELEIEKQAVQLAGEDVKTYVDVLSGRVKTELLQGGKDALQQATQELLNLLKTSQYSHDIMQLAGGLRNAIQ